MDDFFGNLARQVLGSQPELGPLLTPRFATWPDLSPASPPAQAPEPADGPATAEAALFPAPLIDPEHPGSDIPLPSFRQLSQVGTGPGLSIQPGLPSMPEETPETAETEPGDIQPDAAPPLVPAADGSRPEPAAATPPPDVGQTSQPLPAPPAQPVFKKGAEGATDVAPGRARPPADAPVTPLVPEPSQEPTVAPEPAPPLQRVGPARGHPAPTTGLLQPASHSQPDEPSPGQPRPPADAPVTPPVPEPAQEPTVAPEPAPLLQRVGPAQGYPAPTTGPLQPGEPSPGLARPPADTPITPLVPEPAQEPTVAPEPASVIQRQAGPAARAAAPPRPAATPPPARPVIAGQGETTAPPVSVGDQATAAPEGSLSGAVFSLDRDRPTLRRWADTVRGDQAPTTGPLQRASPYQPGDIVPLGYSSPGPANQKAAVQEGPRADAPPAQPGPPTRLAGAPGEPVVLRNGDARADSRIWPGPTEPGIVPAAEASPVPGWSLTQAGERAVSRRMPGWPTAGQPKPTPTVRVTIGRVEVRMAPLEPPPPVQPRQPLRLALSLDEYLQGGEP